MGVIQLSPQVDISDDYRLLTEQVLPELGFKEPEALGVPAFEQVRDSINPDLSAFLISRALRGAQDTLRLTPKIGGSDGIGVRSLITRFDPAAYRDGYVWEDMWGGPETDKTAAFKDKAAVHNNGLRNSWEAVVLLGDTTDPLDTAKPANDYANEPGLVYTNLTVDQERQRLQSEIKLAKQQKVAMLSVPIGTLVIDATALKTEGLPQRKGVARLVHYPNKEMDGFVGVPIVYSYGSRLSFGRTNVDSSWRDNGVRRVVRVPLQLET